MHINYLKKNQTQIERVIDELNQRASEEAKRYGLAKSWSINAETLSELPTLKTGKHWNEFKENFKLLKDRMEKFEKWPFGLQQLVLNSRILKLASDLLKSAIEHTVDKIESKQKLRVTIIIEFQKEIEIAVKKIKNDPSFEIMPLKTSSFKAQYEAAYQKKYSTGCFGFFKLPIKQFFRQKTREAEINFLNDIDNFFDSDMGQKYSFEMEQLIRRSALNLVRMKIENETYGRGSLLRHLIEKKLSEGGYPKNDNRYLDNFLEKCERLSIKVPEGLADFYKNDLKEVDASKLQSLTAQRIS